MALASGAAAAAPTSGNWTGSTVSVAKLQDLVDSGDLQAQDIIHWRAPGNEVVPAPRDSEVIIFADHLNRGFKPPGSLFFRTLLAYYGLRPQDLAPNSILSLSNFTVLCEDYLQMEPSLDLFLEFFYCNPQRSSATLPLNICGGVAIQRRRDSLFPVLKLNSHPRAWQSTFFYCKNISPKGQPRLPGFRAEPLVLGESTNSYAKNRAALAPILSRIRALKAHGLKGTDLVKCWVGWCIKPLSIRPKLICDYTNIPSDCLRFTFEEPDDEEVIRTSKKLLSESIATITLDGLLPFSSENPAPKVLNLLPSNSYTSFFLSLLYFNNPS